MDCLFELNLGYVSCDMCGEGYNTVSVWFDHSAEDRERPFRIVRTSKCYGNWDTSGLTRGELFVELNATKFMIASRRARTAWRKFYYRLENGAFDRGLPQPVQVAEPLPTVDWTDLSDVRPAPCDCNACRCARGQYERLVVPVLDRPVPDRYIVLTETDGNWESALLDGGTY